MTFASFYGILKKIQKVYVGRRGLGLKSPVGDSRMKDRHMGARQLDEKLMEGRRYSLKHSYLSVKAQNENSFGGSQTWSSSRLIRKYGCGIVGISDVLLYLGLHRPDCETDLLYGMVREDGYLSYPRYERYQMKIRRRYLTIIPFFGVPGFLLPVAMNKYFRRYRLPLRAGWGVRPSQIFPGIEQMLEQDIPVILSVGPNYPLPFRRKMLTFYRQENGIYIPAVQVKAHFVVVTGLTDGYLQVSSWGKEYYISWQEYQTYVKKYSNFFVSNICRIREKKRKRKRR